MRLNEVDVARLITACNIYKEKTGSEYMWDEYTELVEKLEQLRWLWNRKTIKVMIETEKLMHGVDTEEDLKKIRIFFQNKKTI